MRWGFDGLPFLSRAPPLSVRVFFNCDEPTSQVTFTSFPPDSPTIIGVTPEFPSLRFLTGT